MGILISLSHCLWSCALLRPPFTEPQTLLSTPSLFVSRHIFSDQKKRKEKEKDEEASFNVNFLMREASGRHQA